MKEKNKDTVMTSQHNTMPLDEQGPKAWHYKRRGRSNKRLGHMPVTQVVMLGIKVTEHSVFRTVDTRKGRLE